MANRRSFLGSALGLGASLFAPSRLSAAAASAAKHSHNLNRPPVPVVTTDVGDLPFTMDGDVKVFELTAHVMQQQIAPNKTIDVWGFNGSAPGPTIQVTEGDRIRVHFHNRLPEPSSIHWHGFEDQIGFDGMPGISQEPVKPGESFTYEFTIRQTGTYFYHSHMSMQELAGMLGAVIMHPRETYQPHCDKDFVIHLQEYAVLPNQTVPNTMNMEFNWLLLNGKAGPATTPLIVRQGERVRLRFINLGMDHHPMHMHGHTFHTTGTEGGRIQESAWIPGNTVLVGVAQARDVEFVANNVGDWMVHCHLPHHMMNQMSSSAGRFTRMSGMAGMQGMTAGASMNNGMGMLDGSPGAPMSEDYGASLGRGMGVGGDSSIATTNGPLSDAALDASMEGMAKTMQQAHKTGEPRMGDLQMENMMAMEMSPEAMQAGMREIAPGANRVPNFPQDAFMESPMMTMDMAVEKPENWGLRPGWSRFMMGMMTFVRVLPPETYDEVLKRMRDAKRKNDPYQSLYRV